MKKMILAMALAVTMLFPAAAQASNLTGAPDNQPLLPSRLEGVITQQNDGAITVRDNNTGDTLVLNYSRQTYILDAGTGAAASLADRQNDNIIAYYGAALASSMPPQGSALAIFVNATDELVTPHYAVAEAVDQSDSETDVTTGNGSQIVVVTDNTQMLPYLTRNMVYRDQIQAGTVLAMWYGITTLSYPGVAQASRAVVLAQPQVVDQGDEAAAEPSPAPSGDETAIDIVPAPIEQMDEFAGAEYDKDGVTMIPLRVAAENRGYEVGWDGDTRTVSLTKDGNTVELVIGVNDYSGDALEFAPEITNDRTFVPESYLAYMG